MQTKINLVDNFYEAYCFALKYLKLEKARRPRIEFFQENSGRAGWYIFETKTIHINTVHTAHQIAILFHELVHYKQHLSGQLKHRGSVFYWKKGKITSATKGYVMVGEEKSYWAAPHEVQARDITKNMLKEFKNNS